MRPQQALGKWFPGFSFRDAQETVIERLMAGHSTLVLMPTGGGKSLTYQLPVLAQNRIGIVLSPLIALMRDQVRKLDAQGVRSLSLGGLGAREAHEALDAFAWTDEPGFIFTSPERIEIDGYLEYLIRLNRDRIALVAVDEAHCISQWGHDFRPPYKTIPGFLDRAFGSGAWPAVLCLTATLDKRSEAEVLAEFKISPSDVVRSASMLRTNLDLRFERFKDTEGKLAALEKILDERRGERIVVYTHLKQNKKAGTRAIAQRLLAAGHRAASFDADMPLTDRDAVVAGFSKGDIDVVCATGAFGMGIDIPNIRGVIHFLLPESLEQYYQEVGRAGRDGKPAFGLLLYTSKNASVRADLIRKGLIDANRVREVWSQLIEGARTDLRSISPALEFGGREDAYALFYAFQRAGALEIVCRGPGRLQVLKSSGPDGDSELSRLGAATRTGSIPTAFRKLGVDPRLGYEQLFDLFRRQQIALVRSPDNVVVYKARTLSEKAADEIAADVDAKVEFRLQEFEAFDQLIMSADRPEEALRAKFSRA